MTVQEKVRSLSWFDTMNNLKAVLLDILENVENLWSRIKALEAKNVLATYADNTAAISGGLSVGTMYKTATGEVRIVV